ncbi:MAG: hypothetical protein ABDH19_04695 [Thermodesulfovibrio sp.]
MRQITAIVNQEEMKLGLILNVIDSSIGGCESILSIKWKRRDHP